MEIIWKKLIYQGEKYNQFSISNDGCLRNDITGTVYKLHKNKTGYLQVCVSLGSKDSKKVFKIHRCVAETFIENPENKPIINHKDGNKTNNNVDNLEWVTYSENAIHAVNTGLMIPEEGVKAPSAKLTEEEVLYIRNNYIPCDEIYGTRGLGRKFGISHSKIINIIKRRTYKNI